MTQSTQPQRSAWAAYLDRRAWIMLMLGFSAGIPILLIFSSLSLWLREAGVNRETVTMFSWAALGYSFKFIWAPLIDAVPLPGLTRWLGRRRSWLLVAQLGIISAIVLMANTDPAQSSALTPMALAAVLLGFSAATQDIVIDAYRIELAPPPLQSVLSATYNAGYRIGMIVAGAGALFLAELWGSSEKQYVYSAWQQTYWLMAAVMGIGVATTLSIAEPVRQSALPTRPNGDYVRLVLVFALSVLGFIGSFVLMGRLLPESEGVLISFAFETLRMIYSLAAAFLVGSVLVMLGVVRREVAYTTWVEPILDFFRRYGKRALLLLLLIGVYRISDIVAGVISNVFYQDMGFSKSEIATAVKTFGVVMVIVGGFVGGVLAQRIRIMRAMLIGAILASLTNLMFVTLAMRGHDIKTMYIAVACDNVASGLAGAVFIAFLSSLTSIRFTAVQYAIFSSLMTLIPKVLGGYSGGLVEKFGYENFFILTTLMGLPIVVLILLVDRYVGLTPQDPVEPGPPQEQ